MILNLIHFVIFAIATMIGQWIAMLITLIAVIKKYTLKGHFQLDICRQIYANGLGSIITQSLYTIYIVGLNMILKIFTEDAVTVLGIYYKIQTFFFIPLLGFQQVILPLVSYNYGAGNKSRNKDVFKYSISFIIVLRQIVLLVPIAWILHFIGLKAVWWTFPITEIISATVGILCLLKYNKK